MTRTVDDRNRHWLTAAALDRVAIDRRTLAAFRIALGVVVLANLLTRARFLEAFYTDRGVLPRATLIATQSEPKAIFAVLPDPWGPILLFPVAGLAALALVVGYRTRAATVVSLALLVLLHIRNPLVLNSGDALLLSLLLWATFLPLDRRWALDARNDDREGTTTSVATVAVLTQVVLVYTVNAAHKFEGESWRAGEAVALVFQADQLTYLLGDVLAGYPTVLSIGTYLWMAMLLAAPLLIVLRGWWRTGVAALFAAAHLGMLVSMPIGLFPLISLTGLVLFVEPVAWNRGRDVLAGTGLVQRCRDWIERVESAVGPSRSVLPRGPRLDRAYALVGTVLPALLFVLVLLSAGSTITDSELPGPAATAIETTNLEQRWQMFAPYPTQTTRWMAFPAERADGTEVDAFRGGEPYRERPPDAADTYPSNRWRKYFQSVREGNDGASRRALAAYLCDRWNGGHATDITTVSIYYGYERTDPFTGEVLASGNEQLGTYQCGQRDPGRVQRSG